MALAALFALMFLRLVDLAVFDMNHDHVSKPHVQAHAYEVAHSHGHDEPIPHDALDDNSAHVGFHALLSVFIDADAAALPVFQPFTACFDVKAREQARAYAHRPPIPPPLV